LFCRDNISVKNELLPGSLRTESVDNVTHFGEQENDDVREAINVQLRPNTSPALVFSVNECNF